MYIFLSYVYQSHCDIIIKEDSNKIVLTRKYLKNSSSSFPFWEMQIKTSLRFHLTPLRMAKVNKPAGTTCLPKHGLLAGVQTKEATLVISLENPLR